MHDRAVNRRLWLGLALTLLCTFLLVRNIDLTAVTTALAQANYVLFLPAGAFYSLALWLKVVRWRQLFPSENRVRNGHLFAALMVSYMGNTVLPARAGELARIYLLHKNDNVAAGVTLTTIVLEKALDILVLLAMLVVLLPVVPLPAWAQRSGIFMGAGLMGLILVLVLTSHRTVMTLRVTDAILRFLPLERARCLIRAQVEKGLTVLRLLRESRQALQVVLISTGIWLSSAVFTYILQAAFHIRAPWTVAIFVVCATNLGMAVPSSPGYVGVYHYIVVQSLALFNVGREAALSYAVVLHLFGFLPVSLLGLWFAAKDSVSIAQWSRTMVHRDEDSSEILIVARDEDFEPISPRELANDCR